MLVSRIPHIAASAHCSGLFRSLQFPVPFFPTTGQSPSSVFSVCLSLYLSLVLLIFGFGFSFLPSFPFLLFVLLMGQSSVSNALPSLPSPFYFLSTDTVSSEQSTRQFGRTDSTREKDDERDSCDSDNTATERGHFTIAHRLEEKIGDNKAALFEILTHTHTHECNR